MASGMSAAVLGRLNLVDVNVRCAAFLQDGESFFCLLWIADAHKDHEAPEPQLILKIDGL